MNTYPEDALIERPTIALFQQLGAALMDCVDKHHFGLRRTRDLLLPKLISGEVEV